jgi:hypothetical protein
MKPDATIGLNYRYKKLQVGLIGYQLMNSKYYYYDPVNNNDMNYQLISHFLMLASYTFSVIPGKLTIAPDIMARTALGLPLQFDMGANLNYRNLLLASVGYRPNSCVYLNLGGMILNNLTLSGAYEYNTGNFGRFTGPSWEIAIGYRFGKIRAATTGSVYADNQKLNAIDRSMQQQSEKIDKLEYENKALKDEIKDNGQKINELKGEIEKFKKEASFTKEEVQELKSFRLKYEAGVEDSVAVFLSGADKLVQDPTEKPSYPPGSKFNVIVGAYKTIKTAKSGQQILLREFDLNTSVIKNPESSFFFIATRQFNKYDEVKAEYDRLKKLGVQQLINGDIWVYEKK